VSSFLDRVKSPPEGFSLAEVRAQSEALGLSLQMAFRAPGAELLVPSVVHFRVDHFGALMERLEDGRFLLVDPTFGNDTILSELALDSEASGYFLVPQGPLPPGWRAVDAEEAGGVYGKGHSGSGDPDATGPGDHQSGGCGGESGMAMATYRIHTMLTSLSVSDTPVGYSPAIGPDVRVLVTYNQREAAQPTAMAFTQFSPSWVSNWVSYIEDDPSVPTANVRLRQRGGGGEVHGAYSSATGKYARDAKSGAILSKLTANTYVKTYPDGSAEYYEHYIGTTGPSRRVFLSRVVDPQGNEVVLGYDPSLPTRLAEIVDATGLQTAFSYDYPGEQYLVTAVEDPFGR